MRFFFLDITKYGHKIAWSWRVQYHVYLIVYFEHYYLNLTNHNDRKKFRIEARFRCSSQLTLFLSTFLLQNSRKLNIS